MSEEFNDCEIDKSVCGLIHVVVLMYVFYLTAIFILYVLLFVQCIVMFVYQSKADSMFVCLMGFYVTVAFSGGGSRSTRREPPNLGK